MFTRPRRAATIALIRGSSSEPEVLMMKRGASDRFLPSYYVFPGGAVDPQDEYAFPLPGNFYGGITTTEARNSLIAHILCGIRETFEESGILLACDRRGIMPETEGLEYHSYRDQVFRGEITFREFLNLHNLSPAFNCIHYLNRWVTPVYSPIRYDTRFFAAPCPEKQHVSHDGNELVETLWITARGALERHNSGKMKMVQPTSQTLLFLSGFRTANELFAYLEQKETGSPLKSF